jgi:hypothetical protein
MATGIKEITTVSRIQLTFNKQPLLADREMDLGEILILYYPHDTPMPTTSATWRKELSAAGYTLESYGRVPPGRFVEPYHEGYVEVRARKARS